MMERLAMGNTPTLTSSRGARWTTHGAVALVGAAALMAAACGTQTPATPQGATSPSTMMTPGQSPQMAGATPLAAQPGGQFMVNCGPGQQALIRPAMVNGQTVSQVDCVAVQQPAVYGQQLPAQYGAVQPVQQAAYPAAQPAPGYVSYPAPTAAPVPVAQGPSVSPAAARPASYRTNGDYVEYEPRRTAPKGRSWKKSAVIVGSSAGIGAGVGAATGGKKGALIGAAIGGGGAAIWDQVTRRK